MGIITNFKHLYEEAFANCKPKFVVVLLKAYSAFCGMMITMALYAFIYRALTDFRF